MKKIIAIALTSLAALAATACWYQKANYNDYIATINNFERHISRLDVTQGSWTHIQAIKYEIDNQLKVDFPITVTRKLTSEKPIVIADAYEEAGEERSARIIRKRIDGSYKKEPQVTLD